MISHLFFFIFGFLIPFFYTINGKEKNPKKEFFERTLIFWIFFSLYLIFIRILDQTISSFIPFYEFILIIGNLFLLFLLTKFGAAKYLRNFLMNFLQTIDWIFFFFQMAKKSINFTKNLFSFFSSIFGSPKKMKKKSTSSQTSHKKKFIKTKIEENANQISSNTTVNNLKENDEENDETQNVNTSYQQNSNNGMDLYQENIHENNTNEIQDENVEIKNIISSLEEEKIEMKEKIPKIEAKSNIKKHEENLSESKEKILENQVKSVNPNNSTINIGEFYSPKTNSQRIIFPTDEKNGNNFPEYIVDKENIDSNLQEEKTPNKTNLIVSDEYHSPDDFESDEDSDPKSESLNQPYISPMDIEDSKSAEKIIEEEKKKKISNTTSKKRVHEKKKKKKKKRKSEKENQRKKKPKINEKKKKKKMKRNGKRI
ncbi:receptor expression-enhancing protein [Anaeramoeba ignava]|uniref:Receptor expression-enhancing protein n=1 Tax=Anaeramoeba ignava TaxID=1746090 RepID=A0A9Q0LBT1_ANAIG|nr:receptor expression-enhancing protein [Anaeramoeba ignava]